MFLLNNREILQRSPGEIQRHHCHWNHSDLRCSKKNLTLVEWLFQQKSFYPWKSHFSRGCKRTSLSKIVTGNFCCQNFFVWLSFFTKPSCKLVVGCFGFEMRHAYISLKLVRISFKSLGSEKTRQRLWVFDEKKRHWGMETFIFLKEKFTVALSGNSFCWKIALYGF